MEHEFTIYREGVAGNLGAVLHDELLYQENLVTRIRQGILNKGFKLRPVCHLVDTLAAGRVHGLHHDRQPEAANLSLGLFKCPVAPGLGHIETVFREILAEQVLLAQYFHRLIWAGWQAQLFTGIGRGRGSRVGSVCHNPVHFQFPGKLQYRLLVGGTHIMVFMGKFVSGIIGQVVTRDDVVAHVPRSLDGVCLVDTAPQHQYFFHVLQSVYEIRDSSDSLLDSLNVKREGNADIMVAALAVGNTRYSCHMGAVQQGIAEIDGVHARPGNVHHHIESGLWGLDTEPVYLAQPFIKHIPALRENIHHISGIVLFAAQGLDGCILGRKRRTGADILLKFGHCGNDFPWSQHIADAVARHAELLRERIDQDGAFTHTLNGHNALERHVVVNEAFIDLIGDNHQIMLLGQLCDSRYLVLGNNAAGRIGRRVDHDGTSSGRDGLLDVRHVKAQVGSLRIVDDDRDSMAHAHHLRVVDIVRGRHDDLVAGIQHGYQRKIESFHGSDRHHDFRHRIKPETLLAFIIPADGLSQFQQTCILRVAGLALPDSLTGSVLDGLMGLHVRVTQREINHIVILLGLIEETAYQ